MFKATVAGRDVEYAIDEKTGVFSAWYQSEKYTHATLAGLKGLLERQMQKKPLSIPVLEVDEDRRDEKKIGVKHGIVVGKHSGNGNLLIAWEGRAVEQYRRYANDKLLRATTNLKTLHELNKRKQAATAAYEKFLKQNQFDAHNIPELSE
jgi:hypothetical protein